MLASLLTMAPALLAGAQSGAQSDAPHAGGAAFSGFKTYWAEKREGCQPMIGFKIGNTSSGEIGPIDFRMEVVDTDKKSLFAAGAASVPSSGLPPGQTKEIVIGGDRDIAPRECLGDMHEAPFSTVHFAIRLTATVGQDPNSVEILRNEPMKGDRVPRKN